MRTYGKRHSLWEDTARESGYPRLAGDLSVDVAVIGAGITGLTAATLLKQAGRSVAIIEAGRTGGGVTGRTTAHITEIVDGRYHTLIHNFGERDARTVAESSRFAIEHIADWVNQMQIDCDFRRVDGYLYTEKDSDVHEIEREIEAAQKLGIRCELTRDVPLPLTTKAALKVENQAQFHPLKYLYALAAAFPSGNSSLFEETHVESYEDGTPCKVHTNRGVITAKEVILATHVPVGLDVSLQTRVAPYRSYVMAFTLREGQQPQGLFWDTEDPYNYIRSYENLVIVGGRDHKTGQEADAESRFRELEDYARQRFSVGDILYRWSAQVYEPVDNLPYIGLNPGKEHIYIATGYAGNGMTYGTIAGRLLADQILGRESDWSAVYDPTRVKPLASAGEFVKENVNVGKRFVLDRINGADEEKISDVPLGEGGIVEIEGHKIAVYRAENGAVHLLEPECTHMGCIVHWNNAEKTWDCPCHGGRYTATGEVVEGPPPTDLKPVKQPEKM
jgi:glycine/D-amino acid oxidase-like deaminating enzyme/nitrite reductase/ring-hydroxylating ferredoxin subunit